MLVGDCGGGNGGCGDGGKGQGLISRLWLLGKMLLESL